MIKLLSARQFLVRILLLHGLGILSWTPTAAQKFEFPELPEEGAILTDFIPEGYHLIKSTQGDINRDGKQDWVWVMEYKKEVKERLQSSGRSQVLTTSPRILGIAFGYPRGVWGLEYQNNLFILRKVEGTSGQEPLHKLAIDAQGHLHIGFHRVSSEKEWEVEYIWSFRENNFFLIRANSLDVDKMTGKRHQNAYDFLSHKVKHTYDNALNKKRRPKIVNFQLTKPHKKTFDSFSRPLTWKIMDGFTL